MRPSLKCAKLFFSSVSRTFCGTTMNLGRLTGNRQKKRNVRIILILSNGALKLSSRLDGCEFYLVDISKRSLTELTLHPEAPHLSSSCSQSETDSHQFMWESRRRLLRNCFISGGRVIQRRHVLHIWVSGGARAALMLFGVKTQEQVRYCCTSSAANGKILCFFFFFFKLYTHWKNFITKTRENRANHMECL